MDNSIPSDTPQSKLCRKCERLLPLTNFNKHKVSSDGLRKICKKCSSEEHRMYYQAHKEERKAYNAKWEQAHKEERLQYHTQRNHANREYHRAFAKQYYREHKEEKRAYAARYHSSEHGKQVRQAYTRSEHGKTVRKAINHKRRIGSHYRRNSFTAQQFEEQIIRQRHRCYYCKQRFTSKDFVWHADHVIPLSKGGTNDISNIVAACPPCNIRKGNQLTRLL